MNKRQLTDRSVKALKPAPPGKRYEVMDTIVPGLGVRVTDKGKKTFVLVARFPKHPENPTRRAITAESLAKARERARHWLELIEAGVDPKDDERRRSAAEKQVRDNTFGVAIEDYIKRRLAGQRRGAAAEREIRNDLIPAWKDMPLTEITRRDVIELVERIAERAPYQAHAAFGHARTFFNWAIDRDVYGLEVSPCDRLKISRLIGAKKPRERVLSDDELRVFWKASARLGYPFGPLFQLLALTGQRKAEVGEARWREFDLRSRVWTVPPERFKSDASHRVPVTDGVMAILDTMPRFEKGDHLFSTTFGAKPVSGFSKAKARLDRLMLRYLQALARARGEDPKKVTLEPFVLHDVRRTVRTRLSGLKVPHEIAEAVIGHGRKGLARVYDQHTYADEMRDALAAWEGRLRSIVQPPPANVVPLRRGAR